MGRKDLIGEDVLDLAEFFVECGGASLGGRLGLVVVHLLVPVDEETLRQSYHLPLQYYNIQIFKFSNFKIHPSSLV